VIFRTDYAHSEAVAVFGKGDPREFCVSTKEFLRDPSGKLRALKVVRVEWFSEGGVKKFREVPGSERELPCDMAVLALGFTGPERGIVEQLPGLQLDQRSNIKAAHGQFRSSLEDVFAAGDCRRGQSLVVWAINEGRGVADRVDEFLRVSAKSAVL